MIDYMFLYLNFYRKIKIESKYNQNYKYSLFYKCSNKFFDMYNKKVYKYGLRKKISEIRNIYDCIELLQIFETTDNMCENIIDLFHTYHPTDNELQKFSLLFQKYENFIDNKGFAANTLWYCIIQWIEEFENLKKNNINSIGIELLDLN